MRAGVVVFAVGNRSRGDDAIGPLLLERLAGALAAQARAAEFALVEDYQLQIEHALDLQGRRLALFIDAGLRTREPVEFRAAMPEWAARDTHMLTPQSVLDVYRRTALSQPPPAFTLCVRGDRFELGEGLSSTAQARLEQAWQLLERLCRRPDTAYWLDMAGRGNDAQCPACDAPLARNA